MTYEELKKVVSKLQEKLENGEIQKANYQLNYTVGFITENFTTKFEVLAVADDTKYIIFKDTKNGNGIITTFREDKLQKVELIRAIIPMQFTHAEMLKND